MSSMASLTYRSLRANAVRNRCGVKTAHACRAVSGTAVCWTPALQGTVEKTCFACSKLHRCVARRVNEAFVFVNAKSPHVAVTLGLQR